MLTVLSSSTVCNDATYSFLKYKLFGKTITTYSKFLYIMSYFCLAHKTYSFETRTALNLKFNKGMTNFRYNRYLKSYIFEYHMNLIISNYEISDI